MDWWLKPFIENTHSLTTGMRHSIHKTEPNYHTRRDFVKANEQFHTVGAMNYSDELSNV